MSMTRPVLRPALLPAIVVLALSFAGCGNSSDESKGAPEKDKKDAFLALSGQEIAEAAVDSMKDAKAYRFSGNLIQDAERLDLDVRTDGAGTCAGELTQQGATTYFVANSSASYIKGNEAFWEQSVGSKAKAKQTMDFLGERWAKTPASDEFADLCDLGRKMFDAADDASGEKFSVGTVSTLNGHRAVEITSVEGDETYRVFVRIDEPHQLLKLVSDTKGDPGEILFDYDTKIEIEEPSAADSVKIG